MTVGDHEVSLAGITEGLFQNYWYEFAEKLMHANLYDASLQRPASVSSQRLGQLAIQQFTKSLSGQAPDQFAFYIACQSRSSSSCKRLQRDPH